MLMEWVAECSWTEWQNAVEYAMKGASSHSGRRSYASRLVESGVDIEDVSRLLGHTDLDYTLIYVSPPKAVIREAFELAL